MDCHEIEAAKPHRQRLEPADTLAVQLCADVSELLEEHRVLALVAFAVLPQVPALMRGILGGVHNGVELVVAQDAEGRSLVAHGPHEPHGLKLLLAAVYEIA